VQAELYPEVGGDRKECAPGLVHQLARKACYRPAAELRLLPLRAVWK
jgi:hypothetical protein